MAKSRKANTARKPPEPSDSHAEIDQWIRSVMPDLHPIVTWLDDLIRETIPDSQFAIKWKKAYYGLPDQGWIIEMVPDRRRPHSPLAVTRLSVTPTLPRGRLARSKRASRVAAPLRASLP